jgi:hypothetical protein
VGRVHKFMINAVVKLTVVIDFILPVLITASCSKLNEGFLVDKRCLSLVDSFKLSIIRYRRVEGSQDD